MKALKLLSLLVIFPFALFAQEMISTTDKEKFISDEINKSIYTDSTCKQPIDLEPNWKSLKRSINKKYKILDSEKIINGAKIRYYTIKKDWIKFADAYLINLEKYDKVEDIHSRIALVWSINNVLYDKIFKNVDDKTILMRAALQAKKVIDNPFAINQGKTEEQKKVSMANLIDTYANLFYRAGDRKRAIEWQRKSIEYTNGLNKEFKAKLEKMEKGEKTW